MAERKKDEAGGIERRKNIQPEAVVGEVRQLLRYCVTATPLLSYSYSVANLHNQVLFVICN
jgi:hypothetical protein